MWREKYGIIQDASKLIHLNTNIWRLHLATLYRFIEVVRTNVSFRLQIFSFSRFGFRVARKIRNCTGCLKIDPLELQHLKIIFWTLYRFIELANLFPFQFQHDERKTQKLYRMPQNCANQASTSKDYFLNRFIKLASVSFRLRIFSFSRFGFCVARKAQNCTGCFKIYSSFNTWRLRLSLYQIHQICYSQHAISFANLFDLYVARKIWSYTGCLKIELLKLQHLRIISWTLYRFIKLANVSFRLRIFSSSRFGFCIARKAQNCTGCLKIDPL